MKLDRLQEQDIAIVKEHYREHPLLIACQRAFKCYQANMIPLLFAPEEVLYESAIIIDHIHELPQTNVVQTYIIDLWNDLRIKLSKMEKTSTPENLDMAVSSILYSVAIVMDRSWMTFYNYDVVCWVLQAIKDNMKVDYQDTMRVFSIFHDKSDGIEDWINNEYDGRFHNEIEGVLKGEKSFVHAVCKTQKSSIIIKHLHDLIEGKSKPKDVMMPIRAAMDAGAIRRPTDEEFYNEFGRNKVKGKSSFCDYTNPDKTPYRGADFDNMITEFKRINEE